MCVFGGEFPVGSFENILFGKILILLEGKKLNSSFSWGEHHCVGCSDSFISKLCIISFSSATGIPNTEDPKL